MSASLDQAVAPSIIPHTPCHYVPELSENGLAKGRREAFEDEQPEREQKRQKVRSGRMHVRESLRSREVEYKAM